MYITIIRLFLKYAIFEPQTEERPFSITIKPVQARNEQIYNRTKSEFIIFKKELFICLSNVAAEQYG